MALHSLGRTEVEVYLDDSERDGKIWQKCVEICMSEGISSILDLENRFVTPSGFRQLWIEKKRQLAKEARNS